MPARELGSKAKQGNRVVAGLPALRDGVDQDIGTAVGVDGDLPGLQPTTTSPPLVELL
jgi:hypothetical protein